MIIIHPEQYILHNVTPLYDLDLVKEMISYKAYSDPIMQGFAKASKVKIVLWVVQCVFKKLAKPFITLIAGITLWSDDEYTLYQEGNLFSATRCS